MGTGTTAVAAIEEKKNWIGSEISNEYCDIIEERVLVAKKRVEEKKEEKDNEPPTLFNAQT